MQLEQLDPSSLDEVLGYLEEHNLGVNRFRQRVGLGISQCLGIVGKRSLPPDISRLSWQHPLLHKLLLDFAAQHVTIPFTSVQVNKNFTCAAHKDVGNQGLSYIVGFGDYIGGELVIEGQEFDIRHKPLLFDGSQLEHWTKPWEGNRYTIVFHTLAPKSRFGNVVPSLDNYEVILHDGVYKIRRKSDGLLLWDNHGLPHPLRGRVKNPK